MGWPHVGPKEAATVSETTNITAVKKGCSLDHDEGVSVNDRIITACIHAHLLMNDMQASPMKL